MPGKGPVCPFILHPPPSPDVLCLYSHILGKFGGSGARSYSDQSPPALPSVCLGLRKLLV